MAPSSERFRSLKRLASGWSIPGWVVLSVWLVIQLLDWTERLATAKEKLTWISPMLQVPLNILASRGGQLGTLITGLVFLFVATWRKTVPTESQRAKDQSTTDGSSNAKQKADRISEKRMERPQPSGETQRAVVDLVRPRLREWQRLREDFESAAHAYHDVELKVAFFTQEKPYHNEQFRQPSYAINLWQYFGAVPDSKTHERIRNMKLTNFGVTGAELTAMAIISGQQTELFRKMAIRAGTLLPDDINRILMSELSQRIKDDLTPGKPVFTTNSNALAKWINLVLIVTSTWHPDRFRNFKLEVDPFAASLAVFDSLNVSETTTADNELQPADIARAIKSEAPFARNQIAQNFVGLIVKWRLALRQVLQNRTAGEVHLVFETSDQFPLVLADVSTEQFSFLKVVHEGTTMQISGRIAKATEFEITLTSVDLVLLEARYA